jgi:TRAP-type uncharacterized transport system fused permease subunit
MRESWYLMLPLAALVWMLFAGYTPMFSGMVGLALTAILILGAALAARISGTAFRVVFWIAVGPGRFRLRQVGIYPIIGLIAVLAAACFGIKGGHKTLHWPSRCAGRWAATPLPVGVACAVVGVIIGILTLTGAATSFAGFIIRSARRACSSLWC